MATTVFSNMVANPNATFPTSLNLSLANNGVSANAFSFSPNAKAVLFNAESTLTGNYSAINFLIEGNTYGYRFDAAYEGKQVAVQLNNGTSYLYTINTIQALQYLSAFNSFDSISPEKQRKWGLEVGGF